MRKIKFRAWDKEEKEMHKDIQEVDGIEVVVLNSKNEMVQSQPEYMHQYFNNVDYELMQYTGLKDKNGVEIYEGDIIAKGYKNGLVTDSEPCEVNMGYLYDSDGYYSGGYLCWRVGEYESLADVCKFAEVKGNIYENPELLEREAE